MKKLLAILLSAAALYTTPVLAAEETQPKGDETLAQAGDIVEPLEEAITGLMKEGEPTTEGYFRRWCPRGYYLVAYRIRIGRFYIIRYACVRYGHRYPGYPDYPGRGRGY